MTKKYHLKSYGLNTPMTFTQLQCLKISTRFGRGVFDLMILLLVLKDTSRTLVLLFVKYGTISTIADIIFRGE